MNVTFNRPYVSPNALAALRRSISSGRLSGDGPEARIACELLESIAGPGHYFLTPSCTHALELACRLIDLGPGDEVILPSFNFPSAATAIALTGATPVFVDVQPDSLNVSVDEVCLAITENTRAVIALHYAGVCADVDEIMRLCLDRGLWMIEDAAHGLGIRTKKGHLGSWGHLSTYSFHETKNIQCGEGGALRVNENSLVERAEILREKGTNRTSLFRGEVDKYRWVDIGSSWLLADPLAALLVSSLNDFPLIQRRREEIWHTYAKEIPTSFWESGFTRPMEPIDQDNAAHMFHVRASRGQRAQLIAHLQSQGVAAAIHYQPLHDSPAGRTFSRSLNCSESSKAGEDLFRLPLYPDLTRDDVNAVVAALARFRTT